ncbi:2091_t:CDS:10 [Funneliformis mosseae]|uniref:2091_t:CDS:1 n=1 Tax=Funneliformis mosseae TaxID=27381 RepID=A0A9N8YUL9_FUNMO|nr:2091_t:CDS:10 [Funneliformis mosseae]
MSTAPVKKLDVTNDKFLGHSVLRTYVTNTFPKNISYLKSLSENKGKIKIFPPYSKTWEGMQSSLEAALDEFPSKIRLMVIDRVGEKTQFVNQDYLQTPGHQIFPPEHNRSEYYEEDGVQTPELFSSIKSNESSEVTPSSNDVDDDDEFDTLQNLKKWRLKSGRFVKDVLYQLGMMCRYHNLVHSLVLDPEDTFVKNAFTEEEMKDISEKKSGQDPPEIDDEFLEYINIFSKENMSLICILAHFATICKLMDVYLDSTTELRKALNNPHPRPGASFNPQSNVYILYRLHFYEMQPNPLTLDMPEAWHRVDVLEVGNATYVIGGEKAGLALIGKKGDAYIRTIGFISTDWAASEAGAKWEGRFCRRKDEEDESGAVLIRTNLDFLAGYVCRYTRESPLEVYAINKFGKSLDVLVEINIPNSSNDEGCQ